MRDVHNPDYGEHKVEGLNWVRLKCEECGADDQFSADREPLDERDAAFIQMGLRVAAEKAGWKVHVQRILCPNCHMERMIARNFEPEKLTDDPNYVDFSE
jgi:RNase P subunit RPR2